MHYENIRKGNTERFGEGGKFVFRFIYVFSNIFSIISFLFSPIKLTNNSIENLKATSA